MIEPIGVELQGPVLAATERYLCEAQQIFDRKFERIPVLFDLRGSTAGMYKVLGKRNGGKNPGLFLRRSDWQITRIAGRRSSRVVNNSGSQ